LSPEEAASRVRREAFELREQPVRARLEGRQRERTYCRARPTKIDVDGARVVSVERQSELDVAIRNDVERLASAAGRREHKDDAGQAKKHRDTLYQVGAYVENQVG